MSYNKEEAIAAQNAATAAATVFGVLVGQGAVEATLDAYEDVRESIFKNTLSLAQAEMVIEAFEAPSRPAGGGRPAGRSGGGGNNLGSVEIKSGKYAGRTIQSVYDSGNKGVEWLEWAAANLNNAWLKDKISAFLSEVA